MPDDIRVEDNPELRRYEIFAEGSRAGILEYRDAPGVRWLVHTRVRPSHEGQGLGGRLARAALDDIREKGVRAAPLCPFVGSYIKENPEYADLIATSA